MLRTIILNLPCLRRYTKLYIKGLRESIVPMREFVKCAIKIKVIIRIWTNLALVNRLFQSHIVNKYARKIGHRSPTRWSFHGCIFSGMTSGIKYLTWQCSKTVCQVFNIILNIAWANSRIVSNCTASYTLNLSIIEEKGQ